MGAEADVFKINQLFRWLVITARFAAAAAEDGSAPMMSRLMNGAPPKLYGQSDENLATRRRLIRIGYRDWRTLLGGSDELA